MSGVLHPVGPEPARTYWLRRAVLLAVLAALVGLVAAMTTAVSRGSQAAEPAVPVTATPTPTPTLTDTPSTMTATPSSTPSASASPESTTARRSSAPLPTAPPAPVACDPAKLRPTLMGSRSLRAGRATTFAVSLINGSAAICTLKVSSANFELKVYSGTDRIWSTKDCSSSVKTLSTAVSAERALAWKQTWNGARSSSGCKSGSTKPRPGVYWATAQFRGAEPVQLRMIIR